MARRRHQITRSRRVDLFDAAGWICFWCGTILRAENDPVTYAYKRATLDHIIPLVLGGLDIDSNLVTACLPCNNRKDDMSPLEWAHVRPLTDDQWKRVRLALEEQRRFAEFLLDEIELGFREDT